MGSLKRLRSSRGVAFTGEDLPPNHVAYKYCFSASKEKIIAAQCSKLLNLTPPNVTPQLESMHLQIENLHVLIF